jgi:hypothetical protein
MGITCLFLRRGLMRYQDGELGPRGVKLIEDHLLNCGTCRARLLQFRNGQRFARELPRLSPEPENWERLEAAIDANATQRATAPSSGTGVALRALMMRLMRPMAVAAALALVVVTVGMLALYMRTPATNPEAMAERLAGTLDRKDFHAVAISDISSNTEPHVVAEGYVSEIRHDEEDGDLVFKLVDDPHHEQPFIVCEIINPISLAPPAVGSRVRVYGVSRFDAKADHRWYELHPVLNIEQVRKGVQPRINTN